MVYSMNILFVSDAYNIGGGERNLLEVAISIRKKGNNILICIPSNGDFKLALEANGLDVICYNEKLFCHKNKFKLIMQSYKAAVYLKSVFETKNYIPNVVHSNNGMTVLLAYFLKRLYHIPSFWTCHGPWETVRGIKSWGISHMMDGTFTITPEIYIANTAKNKILIPLGIKMDVDTNNERKNREKKSKRKILCAARFSKIKGQDILVRAFEKLYKNDKNVELHFFGETLNQSREDCLFFSEIRKYVQSENLCDVIFFHKFDPNIRSRMLDYDIVCIPSRYESFSIVALEAMQLGLKVVAPNIGGPSYIIENMKSGLLFNPESVEDLADKLCSLIAGDVILSTKEIKSRAQMFDVDEQARRMLNEYKKNSSDFSIST